MLLLSLKFRPAKDDKDNRQGEDRSDMNEKLYIIPLDEGTRRFGGWLLNELCKRFTLKPQSGIVSRLPEESFNQKQNQYYATIILSKLELLKGSYDSAQAEFFVLYGRRRVGKMELLARFCE